MEEAGRSRTKHFDMYSKQSDALSEGYFSWGAPLSLQPRGSEMHQIPYPHFALIAIDGRGCVKYHTSQSLERHCHYVFTPDVKERFMNATGEAKHHSRSHGRIEIPAPKKRRLELEEIPDISFENVDRVPLKIGDEERILDYYESAFRAFQQINCRQIAKAFIKIIEPRKQVKHPYNGGRGASGEKGDPEKTKPDWWPAGVIHREPDHLKKPERIRLLVHIIRNLRKSHNITTEKLEEAGRDVKRQIKPRERWEILEEIYAVRRMEESFERGEIDAKTVIYVVNRDSSAKSERDSECLSDCGHSSLEGKETFLPPAMSRYPKDTEDNIPAIKYLPPSDFVPSPIEQAASPAVTADTWSFQQSPFHPVGYDVLPSQSIPPVTAAELHMRLPTQFDYVPLAAPSFQPGPIGHSQLLPPSHQESEAIPYFK
ncbi:hypothetical protein LOZ04_005338 [Ophidiomyces ophidiicola]|nr:hypothetical protein LOZ59_005942 [Ophidiomyces ophidiicola]KAI1967938.1 hypothetical protein LOZ56_005313 [Ophidiomyces ophidiicola]KAI2001410.1 hypothetical protein LOZ50_005706 [Ophidiomyces ophidiicola]KAI2018205.1 hypothetical protein LOZ45_005981 [Ophidiomyces ophidiicola]KAI2033566.1 hypothetical protein LOZ47_005384 [Ophidiomyces ophidiicola]